MPDQPVKDTLHRGRPCDARGAPAIRLAAAPAGAILGGMSAPFDQHVTFLYAEDPEPSWRFYEDVLGLPLAQDQGSCRIYAVAPGGRAYLGVCRARGPRVSDNPRVQGGAVITFVGAGRRGLARPGWSPPASRPTRRRPIPRPTASRPSSSATRPATRWRCSASNARTGPHPPIDRARQRIPISLAARTGQSPAQRTGRLPGLAEFWAEWGDYAYLAAALWAFFEGETFVLAASAIGATMGMVDPWLLMGAVWIGSYLRGPDLVLPGAALWAGHPAALPEIPAQGRTCQCAARTLWHAVHPVLPLPVRRAQRRLGGVRAGGYPKLRFAVLNFIAAGVWAGSFVAAGWFLGAWLGVERLFWSICGIAATALAFFVIRHFWRAGEPRRGPARAERRPRPRFRPRAASLKGRASR